MQDENKQPVLLLWRLNSQLILGEKMQVISNKAPLIDHVCELICEKAKANLLLKSSAWLSPSASTSCTIQLLENVASQ